MQALKNQNGFSALDAILSVLLIGAIGAASYFAYQNQHKTATQSSASKTQATGSSTPTPTPTPTAGWTTGSLSVEKLNFKYPSTWKLSTVQDAGLLQLVQLKDTTGFIITIDAAKAESQAAKLGPSGSAMTFNTTVGSFVLGKKSVYLLDDRLASNTSQYTGTFISSCNGTKVCWYQNTATNDDIEAYITYNRPGETDHSGGPDAFDPSMSGYVTALQIIKTLSF